MDTKISNIISTTNNLKFRLKKQTITQTARRLLPIYPNKNKKSGAYSCGGYDTKPFVLLNYTNTYNDKKLSYELSNYILEESKSIETKQKIKFIIEILIRRGLKEFYYFYLLHYKYKKNGENN